tara:strand:+ start:5074 stop:5613 length:540 start_codon:yes stop_codon:yes gene_type:complete
MNEKKFESKTENKTESRTESKKRVLGVVKWFNNKLGYGFISHKKENNEEQDIFVHWSNLLLNEHDFRTLYKDEVVEFEIQYCNFGQFAENKNKAIQACNVSGPNFSKLISAKQTNNFQTSNYSSTKYSNVFSVKQLSHSDLKSMENNSKKLLHVYYSENYDNEENGDIDYHSTPFEDIF